MLNLESEKKEANIFEQSLFSLLFSKVKRGQMGIQSIKIKDQTFF